MVSSPQPTPPTGTTLPHKEFQARREKIRKHLEQTNQVASQRLKSPSSTTELREIERGAAKIVYCKSPPRGGTRPETAYYVPVRHGRFFSKEAELRDEKQKMDEIKKNAQGDDSNLAVEISEVPEGQRIKHLYTLQVRAAQSDFEKTMREKVGFADRIKLGRHFINGLRQLHAAGYAYGDPKPENYLVYKDKNNRLKELKIADFGKTEKMGADGKKMYKGNLRFAPPEGVLSQKGDVYGAAIILIRNFEEAILDEKGTSLIDVPIEEREPVRAASKRRGVEKMIVNHKAFPGIDEPSLSDKIFRRLPRQAQLTQWSESKKQEQQRVLAQYIWFLCKTLKDQHMITRAQQGELRSLLNRMIDPDPNKRPTMQEVVDTYNKIFRE